MKISLKWVNDFVDVTDFLLDPTPLEKTLTFAGLEVESIENQKNRLRFVVVGLILQKNPHPNSERLTLCQVTTGEGRVHEIVCGARNHNAGDKVVVALPGAELPGGLRIEKSQIRGVESQGMLCSREELGLEAGGDGILILPSEAPLGESFAKYFGLDDVIFEIKVTPNRADVLSHLGLAREIAILCERPLKPATGKLPTQGGATISVAVQAFEACPRYLGRSVHGVKNIPSPDWLKARLQAVGEKSINALVDVTNYVMFELGQPLHAFDEKKIRGAQIQVRFAKSGESMLSFDGTQLKFTGEELLICDGEGPLALAGIVGGQHSGVQADTTNLFVESAYFTPGHVRKTSRRLGVQTESAYRFARGIDPQGALRALDRACELYQSIFQGRVSELSHAESTTEDAREVKVRLHEVAERAHLPVSFKDFSGFLKRMQLQFSEEGEVFQIRIPSHRVDLEEEIDFVEEYARLRGYDAIPEVLPPLKGAPIADDPVFLLQRRIQNWLLGRGYSQTVHSALGSKQKEDELGDFLFEGALGKAEAISVVNPISDDFNALRRGLAAGLLQNLDRHQGQSESEGQLFELGSVFRKKGKYEENLHLGVLHWQQPQELWKDSTPLVLKVKDLIQDLAHQLGVGTELQNTSFPRFLHPGRSTLLVHKSRVVGWVGEIHPEWMEKNKWRGIAVLAELDLTGDFVQPSVKVQMPSRYPKVRRDLAFIMPESAAASSVLGQVQNVAWLEQVQVQSVYQGQPLSAGEKSVAYSFDLRKPDATLKEEEINAVMQNVRSLIEKNLGFRLR